MSDAGRAFPDSSESIRCLWITDVHLNHLPIERAMKFLDAVAAAPGDCVLLTGDVAESPEVVPFLRRLADRETRPIYFVLGNHDFYFDSIAETRRAVAALNEQFPQLHYLTAIEGASLSPHTAIIGHDGWADARAGDFDRSMVMMNDYRYIHELSGLDKRARRERLRALGDEAAAHLTRSLDSALGEHEQVVVLIHPPPFREACWYEGAVSNDEWAPHFTCVAAGKAIFAAARQRPERRITVLCGHTHSPGEAQILPNLRVLTGGAEYGKPEIQRTLEFPA